MEIKKAVVIGAGVMGSNIAAHLANAGVEVELLDIVPKDAEDRDVIAKGAIERMTRMKGKEQSFMDKRNARNIRPGNVEDHMDRIADADLVIEAVLENPKIKSDLFKKIDAHRKEGSIIGSNTSTIPLDKLKEGQSEQFQKDLVITHFFNPPRYMQLLELVSDETNDADKVAAVRDFMDEKLGKTVVECNDTPGFIANRIGTVWMEAAMKAATDHGLSVMETDAVASKPIGTPMGIFKLMDRVGLDLVPHISESLKSNLEADDLYHKVHEDRPLLDKMIEQGLIGDKKGAGFYRKSKGADGKTVYEVMDLQMGEYIASKKVTPKAAEVSKKKGLKGLVTHKSKEGKFAWDMLKNTLLYSAQLVPEIADDITAIDDAMKTGYNWKHGPFEMIDKMGVDWFIKRLEKDGEEIPPLLEAARGKKFYRVDNGKLQHLTLKGDYKDVERPDGVLLLSDIKRGSKPVASNKSASLWDIGDGVLCLEFHSKMNSLNPLTMRMVNKAVKTIEKSDKYKALVIHNESPNFSVGANIGLALYAAKARQYWVLNKMVKSGQDAYKNLKYSKFPVVGAPSGMALGGGCEILLHCDAVQAHGETYMGLVEAGVGLIPGWGGTTEMITRAATAKRRAGGPMPPVAQAFETIGTAKVSLSAAEARNLQFLNEESGVTMNKSRLLADAKKKALAMADAGYTPPKPVDIELPGPAGRAALNMAVDQMYLAGHATPYDVVVMDRLAEILTGGDKAGPGKLITQDELRDLEREVFMDLVHDKRTRARIEMMLKTNKPLREKPIAGKTSSALRKEARGKIAPFKRIESLEKPAKGWTGCGCPLKDEFKGATNDNKTVESVDKTPANDTGKTPAADPAVKGDKKANKKPGV